MAFSPDIVGKTYMYPDYYEVGREKIREFARAVKNDDASFFDDEAARALGHDAMLAPLTFISVFGLMAQLAFFEYLNVPIMEQRVVQADQELKLHLPVAAGDRLYCHIRVESLRQAFGADVLTLSSRITNQRGELVQEASTSLAGHTETDV